MTFEEARTDLMLAQADISYRPKDDSIDMAIEALKKQKTGHWIDYGARYDVRCSICNTQCPLKPIGSSHLKVCKSDYCPSCGAKMKGESNAK